MVYDPTPGTRTHGAARKLARPRAYVHASAAHTDCAEYLRYGEPDIHYTRTNIIERGLLLSLFSLTPASFSPRRFVPPPLRLAVSLSHHPCLPLFLRERKRNFSERKRGNVKEKTRRRYSLASSRSSAITVTRLHIVWPYTCLPAVFFDFRLSNFFRAYHPSLIFSPPSLRLVDPSFPRFVLILRLKYGRAVRMEGSPRSKLSRTPPLLVSTVSLNRVVFAVQIAFTLHAFFASPRSRPFLSLVFSLFPALPSFLSLLASLWSRSLLLRFALTLIPPGILVFSYPSPFLSLLLQACFFLLFLFFLSYSIQGNPFRFTLSSLFFRGIQKITN